MWLRYRRQLAAGEYDAVFASPSCRTFSEARLVRPGPPILREFAYPYGYPKSQAKQRGLSQGDFQKIREDNLLAERTAEACDYMRRQGSVYAVEQPYPWQGSVSMFDLDSFRRLRRKGGNLVVFDQCRFGGQTKKPTQVLYSGASFEQLQKSCNHEVAKHFDDEGNAYYSAHPTAVGQVNPDGSYKTKALVAYPPGLNAEIARIIAEVVRSNSLYRAPS